MDLAPSPFKPTPGKTYLVCPGDRVYIRSPRSPKSTRWVAAVVRNWDEKSQTWRVQVIQPNLVESDWLASLIENRWKMRRKLTHSELKVRSERT